MWQKYLFMGNGIICSPLLLELFCAYFLFKHMPTKDDKMVKKSKKLQKRYFHSKVTKGDSTAVAGLDDEFIQI